jgi:hypothetical protein
MTSRRRGRRVEIKNGEQTVAAAEVTTSQEPEGTAQASLHAISGHVAPRAARVGRTGDGMRGGWLSRP